MVLKNGVIIGFLLTSPLLPIRFSFCLRLQNQTRTVSLSISSSSASCEISALVGRELRKNAISNATKKLNEKSENIEKYIENIEQLFYAGKWVGK